MQFDIRKRGSRAEPGMTERLLSGDPPFLMHGLLPAPPAELFEFDLPLDGFLVLARVIIPPLADGTAQGDQVVGTFCFGHGRDNTMLKERTQCV